MFTGKEIEYRGGQRLGRLAAVTPGGRADVVPTVFRVGDARTRLRSVDMTWPRGGSPASNRGGRGE